MKPALSVPGYQSLGLAVRRHSLAWLTAANAVGVLLSLLLVYPGLGDLFPALSYGRWVPLHLDGQLYGWCAMPLIGLLFAWYLPRENAGGQARLALLGWTLALALGCLSWLSGVSSGKLFMDWSGWARPLLPLAMLGLWVVLANAEETRAAPSSRVERWSRRLLLLVLLVVPFAFYWAEAPEVFPSVNPDSGGATGASLLGSTLGIIFIYGAAPWMLGQPLRGDRPVRFALGFFVAALCLSSFVLALTDHGNASHHLPAQIAALAVLFLFAPGFVLYFRSFYWPAAARPWLKAAALWWCLLLATGWLAFLPGYAEHSKFTHLLVAHAHLALAAFVTSANWVLLLSLEDRAAPGRLGFWLWQLGTGLHLVVLCALGVLEQVRPSELFLGGALANTLFALRACLGVLLLSVSVVWLFSAWRIGRDNVAL